MASDEMWRALSARDREQVLNILRVDYENWLEQGPDDDAYPSEGKLRAAATAAAILALGGSVEWTAAAKAAWCTPNVTITASDPVFASIGCDDDGE